MFRGIWTTFFTFVFAFGVASAQNATTNQQASSTAGGTSSISGTVVDNSGRPISGVTVEVYNTATSIRQTTDTDQRGNFMFRDIPIGANRISVAGNTGTVRDLDLTSAGIRGLQITSYLVTDRTKLITDTQAPVTMHRTDQIMQPFENRSVTVLPQPNFRSMEGETSGPYNLGLLSEGMASTRSGPVYGGSTPYSNNFHVDGIDNNNWLNRHPAVYVSNQATQEVTLMQNPLQPEFGHSTGGEFNAKIKSGTNQVHGTLYDYLQNRNMNARDVLQSRAGITDDPRYDQNRLGASIGAPIVKDRAFFFGNFEYIPLGFSILPASGIPLVPTAAGYNVLSGMNTLSRSNLTLLQNSAGMANTATSTTMVNGVTVPVGPVANYANGYQNSFLGTGALDFNLTDANSLHARYVYNDIRSDNAGALLPGFVTSTNTRSMLANISDEHRFTPNVINELRLGYTRFEQSYPNGNFTLANGTAFPAISIEQDLNLNLGQNSGRFGYSGINNYHLADTASILRGGHEIKVGFDGRRDLSTFTDPFSEQGMYGYSNLNRFLMDYSPDLLAQRSFSNTAWNANNFDLFGFITDRWKVRSNVTVDLGLNYEYVTVPASIANQGLNSGASVPGVINFSSPVSETHNFAPKVGFAYSPTQLHGTVFRAGFGMNYDSLPNPDLFWSAAPMFGYTAYGSMANTTTGFLNGGGLTAPANPQATAVYGPKWMQPYAMQWNAAVQQQLWRNMVLEVKYLGSAMRHLPVLTNLNSTNAITAANSLPLYYTTPTQAELNGLSTSLTGLQAANPLPLAQYGFNGPVTTIDPSGNSSYHALSVQLTHRFTGGFQMLGNYTWSHMIDDVTPGYYQSAYDRSLDSGNSIYDRRHRVTITSMWDPASLVHSQNSIVRNVLLDLSLGGTFTYQSPGYVSALSGGDTGLNFVGPDRAIFNENGTAGVGSGVTPLCNSSGQVVAYQADNPSAQYIQGAPGLYANGGRNNIALGQVNNFDLYATKRFSYHDRVMFEVRGEAYNVFNHAQFTATPTAGLFTPGISAYSALTIPGSNGFGDYRDFMSSNPRLLQVALRISF